MPARTTRQQARQRAIDTFMASLDRIIPPEESAPLRGSTFLDWENQVAQMRRAVLPVVLGERSALEPTAQVESGGPCPHCGSDAVYLERQTTRPEVLGPDGPVLFERRRVLHPNVGYFTRHKAHMNYPEFRRRGWPIGSGVTEAGVKQFHKRVKGTEPFWREEGVESVLSLRGTWLSQDERWERYWASRPAYVN